MAAQTPKSIGFTMPPEWHPHAATLLHWPDNPDTWPGERLERVELVYLNIIRILHKYEPVVLLVSNPDSAKKAEDLILAAQLNTDKIHLLQIPLNDVWARDCGPIFVCRNHNGKMEYAITDWEYNAWGEKYPPYDDDNRIPELIADKFTIPHFKTGMILEGGSIDVNGAGVLMTTESVLLNPNRNPGMAKMEIEERLCDYLGVQKIIWLKNGLKGDDTDGHIDDLSRFVNQSTIVTSLPENTDDINYPALNENFQILKECTDLSGKPFDIITLPLPETKIEGTTVDGSEYVPASYANFYIANGVVLLPFYDKSYDNKILEIFRPLFPDRDIIGIECSDLVWGQGSIHCITQQLYGIDI